MEGVGIFIFTIVLIVTALDEMVKAERRKARRRNRKTSSYKKQHQNDESIITTLFNFIKLLFRFIKNSLNTTQLESHNLYNETHAQQNRTETKDIFEETEQEQKSTNTSYTDQYYKRKQKGIEYEKYVADIYRKRGYDIWARGVELGRKDGGIDIVAYNDYETILIQCKHWSIKGKRRVRQKDIKAFKTDIREFLSKYNMFMNDKIIGRYVISDRILDKGAYRYIKESKNLDFEIIAM